MEFVANPQIAPHMQHAAFQQAGLVYRDMTTQAAHKWQCPDSEQRALRGVTTRLQSNRSPLEHMGVLGDTQFSTGYGGRVPFGTRGLQNSMLSDRIHTVVEKRGSRTDDFFTGEIQQTCSQAVEKRGSICVEEILP